MLATTAPSHIFRHTLNDAHPLLRTRMATISARSCCSTAARRRLLSPEPLFLAVISAATTNDRISGAGEEDEEQRVKARRNPGEAKGFVEEMRLVGRRNERSRFIVGYITFLVEIKVVYDALEGIVDKTALRFYAKFRNTGLERSVKLAQDIKWFKEQGHNIPKPSNTVKKYAKYLKALSLMDPQAFICHFCHIYFALSARGRIYGEKVDAELLDGKELEFYKWDAELLKNVSDNLNNIASNWTREEKDHCLMEIEKSYEFLGLLFP